MGRLVELVAWREKGLSSTAACTVVTGIQLISLRISNSQAKRAGGSSGRGIEAGEAGFVFGRYVAVPRSLVQTYQALRHSRHVCDQLLLLFHDRPIGRSKEVAIEIGHHDRRKLRRLDLRHEQQILLDQ